MSTDTFAFDDTAATRILGKVTSSGEFLKTPPQELRTKDYERERRRLTSFDLHSVTLAEYYRLNRIPRGLRSHLRPTLFSDKPDFCEKFQKILNKCSLDIILLTIDFLQTAIIESEAKLTAIEEQLSTTLTATDWSSLKTKTDKTIDEHRKYLQDKKRSKFQRDSEDYASGRVYRWNDSVSTYTRRGYSGPRQYGPYSSDSDSSTSGPQNRFLFGRPSSRPNTRPGGDRQGGPPGNRERMTTRSQV
ncbi:uncharacterized protein LOC143767907 [Ranitomeya variabilis]|uniref:uncharacterized protein LOC143767907 n=1 Tax=Ranitomeya variabilis TaxID=490064 RepID=UPI004055E38C